MLADFSEQLGIHLEGTIRRMIGTGTTDEQIRGIRDYLVDHVTNAPKRQPIPEQGHEEDLLEAAAAKLSPSKSLILTNLDPELAAADPNYAGSLLMGEGYVYGQIWQRNGPGFKDLKFSVAVRSPVLKSQLRALGEIRTLHLKYPRLLPYRNLPMGLGGSNWRLYRQFWELPGF